MNRNQKKPKERFEKVSKFFFKNEKKTKKFRGCQKRGCQKNFIQFSDTLNFDTLDFRFLDFLRILKIFKTFQTFPIGFF